MVSAMQGFIGSMLNRAVAPVSSSTGLARPRLHMLTLSWVLVAPAEYRSSDHIGPDSVIPQLWPERILFPRVGNPVHSRHHPEMGPQARPEAYSEVRPLTPLTGVLTFPNLHEKVEDHVSAARTINDPPVGEFSRVGKDGYQQHREHSERCGVITSGPEREISV